MEELRRKLSVSKRLLKIILGADLNTTLPGDYEGITGTHVLSRSGQNKERVSMIVNWLATWGLRALNTWPGDISDSEQK
eukprot:7270226-Karenia_brevis.AAC.1